MNRKRGLSPRRKDAKERSGRDCRGNAEKGQEGRNGRVSPQRFLLLPLASLRLGESPFSVGRDEQDLNRKKYGFLFSGSDVSEVAEPEKRNPYFLQNAPKAHDDARQTNH
jgi:hypothetical protein